MKIAPDELGGLAARRGPLPPTFDRQALARGWLIYLAVMLIFVGLTAVLHEEPKTAALVAAPAIGATSAPGKFAH